MSTDTENETENITIEDTPEPPRLLGVVVEKSLPLALQKKGAEFLFPSFTSVRQFVPKALAFIVNAYRLQMAEAFDKILTVLHIACVVFCFGEASFSYPLLIALGAVVLALALFDAYLHDARKPGAKYLEEACAAITAAFFLLASQALMWWTEPSLALSFGGLSTGLIVCLPMLYLLRVVVRPGPSEPPFEGSNLTVDQIYTRTQLATILWAVPCIGTVVINSQTMKAFLPEHDNLYIAIPMWTFMFWVRLQQNPFGRRRVQKLKDARKQLLVHWRERLLKGVEPNEERAWVYFAYVAIQVLFFFELSIPSAAVLWSWLSGHATLDLARLGLNLVTFVTPLLTWNYIKALNQAAAGIIQKEIDALVVADVNPITQ